MKKASLVLVAIALATFGLVACGGDDDDDGTTAAEETTEATTGGGGGGGAVDISAAASGDLAYDQSAVEAPAGTVTINFDNPSGTPHDVAVEDEGGSELAKTEVISESTASTSADLQAGSYTFFCTVPGHREAGMEGTLTVE
jgi:plastocyanin